MRRRAAGAVGIAILFALWSLAASRWPPHVLPGPGKVLATIVESRATLADQALRTLRRVATGYMLAVGVGLPLAVAMALSPRLDRAVGGLLALARSVPPFAWTPLLLLWVGIGDRSAAIVVFLGAFFPIARLARAGLASAPPSLLVAARNLGASRATVLTRVLFPAALPSTLSGLRLGWTLAWMSVVAAELVGADGGLGQMVLDARNLARPDIALAGMACIGGIAAASESAFGLVEARVLRWRA